ncbi:MAG: YhdP family protein [Gammaproteobacteria bacterium]
MLPILRSIITALASIVIVVIIVTAAALGLARLLLPVAGQYRAEIAQQISAVVGRPVTIGALDAAWQGMNPYLRLKDLRVLDEQAAHTLLHFADVRIGVNIPYYVRHGRFEHGSLKVSGTALSVIRQADGNIVLEGFEQHRSTGQFVGWLLSQNQLSIENSRISWTDRQKQGERVQLTGVNLKLRSNGRRHQADGVFSLAGARGRPVNVALDFTGKLTDPAHWSGKFYMQAIGLDLTRWLSIPSLMGNKLTDGQANFRLWGEWAGGNLQRLQGEVAAQDLRFVNGQASASAIALNAVTGQLHWRRTQPGWLLQVAQLTVKQGAKLSTPGQLQARSLGGADQPQVDVRFKFLPLQDVSALVLTSDALSPGLREALTVMRPRGELHDLHLSLQPGGAGPAAQPDNNFYIETRLVGLTVHAWKNLPAMQNIDALLRADEQGGLLEVDSRSAKLDFPVMFRAPLTINVLTGNLGWYQTAQGWRLTADGVRARNADINASLNGTIDVPADNSSPFLNLRIGFENGNIANTSAYLPVNHVPPRALNWLDKSLVGGRITSGSALVHGRAHDFPFKTNQGNFETRFNVTGGILDYKPDWPPVQNLEADIVFRGQGLEIDATGGQIFGTEIIQAHAAIPELGVHEPQLTVQGKASGTTTDALRFLKEGPLQAKFVNYVSGLSASGKSVLNLDLLIPLKGGKDRVTGSLGLADSTLRYGDPKQSLDVELTDINGVLNFTETNFGGNNIAARLRGQALHLDVSTSPARQDSGEALIIAARGTVTAAQLRKQAKQAIPDIKPGLFERLVGTTAWSAALKFHQGAETELLVKSDLQGMAVDLPPPAGKTASEPLPLTVSTTLSKEQGRRYSVVYGERAQAVFKLLQTDKTTEFGNGIVNFGGGAVPKLPTAGLRISGSLPQFSLDAWRKIFASADNNATSGIMQKISDIDVSVGALEVFKQKLSAARIEGTKTAQQWSLRLTSDQVAGAMTLPQAPDAAWVMDFERLHLAKSATETAPDSSLDPRRLPVLRVTSKSFKYGDGDLGQLILETSKRATGMHVDSLKLQAPEMTISGQGDWLNEGGGPVSRFDFEVDSKGLGNTLTNLGYDTNIAGGKTHIDLTAHWTGAPMDFALARLNGTLSMSIEKGRFLDIDPGAGRIFGLLSIQALPRRLSLDFSDLFKKGFAFDTINSEFALKDGNAYTSNLLMKGPSAIVSVTGRTGLAAKDYDQVVTVKPQIGASLPLAATLAGGPVAGAAVFLAQKIFQPQIDDLTGYQYTITGPWKDPNIDKVKPTTPADKAPAKP